MRIHLIGQANLPSLKIYNANPFTQKIINFAKMMSNAGHKIFFYGVESSEVMCHQNIPTVPFELWNTYYGSFDWKNFYFKKDTTDIVHKTFVENTVKAIKENYKKDDVIVFFDGAENKKIIDKLSETIKTTHVEGGIGYGSSPWARFKVFESYAVFHSHYGQAALLDHADSLESIVIPNFLDPDDFYPAANPKRDYYLFIGRLIPNKGVEIAIETTRKLSKPLVIAGVYNPRNTGFSAFPEHVSFIGHADNSVRLNLYQNAIATFVPTLYHEPFGNVAVESMLCGTPVITTDTGAFTENVKNGLNGFRCRTMKEFIKASENVSRLYSDDIVQYASSRFTLKNIEPRYTNYLIECIDHNKVSRPVKSKFPTDFYTN